LPKKTSRINNNSFPIFVINLDRSQKRRSRIVKMLEEYKYNFEIISAVDGYSLSEEEKSQYSAESSQNALNRELVPGEIGCALSHIKVYKRILDEDWDSAIVLEDDATIEGDIESALSLIKDNEQTNDLVFLGHRGNTIPSFWYRKNAKNIKLAPVVNLPYGAFGYWLNRKAAQILSLNNQPIHLPADVVTARASQFGLMVRGIFPPVITQAHIGENTIIKPKGVVNKKKAKLF
jgi:glycosyl transferase family 25